MNVNQTKNYKDLKLTKTTITISKSFSVPVSTCPQYNINHCITLFLQQLCSLY